MRIPWDGGEWVALSPHPNNAVSTNNTDYKVATRLDADEKGVYRVDTLGGKQNLTVINESGLYNVILRSDKPEAV